MNGPWPKAAWPSAAWPDVAWPGPAAATLPQPGSCGNDLMAAGAAWITGQLQAHASRPVVYVRGTAGIAVCASIGRTLLKLDDGDGGIRMEWTDRDFLIPTAKLILGGVKVTPERGDLIRERHNGILSTFEVLAPGGEPPWRWSDPHRNLLRIHAKLVSEVPA